VKDKSKFITIMLVPDGTEARLAWRTRRWVAYAVVWGIGLLLAAVILFLVFYGHILTRAAQTDRLIEENQALLRYRYKVELLEQNLVEAREFVSRMATMAGIDYEFPGLPDDSTIFAGVEDGKMALLMRASTLDLSFPSGLPVQGFITQDFEVIDTDRLHPGIDIACAVGTPVLATAAGEITSADFDSTYGKILVLKHNDSVTTVYGHNDSLLVSMGQNVLAGSRIALSGSTGKSTAPHVHYEIRIHDKPTNPTDYPNDK
jgi:murein DD-endopeptidase MepM/ murein hydrolase activator NlpD